MFLALLLSLSSCYPGAEPEQGLVASLAAIDSAKVETKDGIDMLFGYVDDSRELSREATPSRMLPLWDKAHRHGAATVRVGDIAFEALDSVPVAAADEIVAKLKNQKSKPDFSDGWKSQEDRDALNFLQALIRLDRNLLTRHDLIPMLGVYVQGSSDGVQRELGLGSVDESNPALKKLEVAHRDTQAVVVTNDNYLEFAAIILESIHKHAAKTK
jgi:hypothetical protein